MSNIQSESETSYIANQACWIRQLNSRFFNNQNFVQNFMRTKHNILPTAKIAYQPYGTFMDFSKPVYQDARICDLRYTPSAGFKKINNQDLFIIKNEKYNNSIIKAALGDYVIIGEHL